MDFYGCREILVVWEVKNLIYLEGLGEFLQMVMIGFSGEGRLKKENEERKDKVKGEERWIFGKLVEGLRVKVGEG